MPHTQAQRQACDKQTTVHYLCHEPRHALTHNDTPHQICEHAAAAFCLCVWIHRHWNRQTFRSSLKAQCTFKSLLIHGILLFSMFITLCCTLHHHPSQGIQCWKLCGIFRMGTTSIEHQAGATKLVAQRCCSKPRWCTKLVQHITFAFVRCMHTIARVLAWTRSNVAYVSKCAHSICSHHCDRMVCKWSFRRFTYGNLVTTSPSSKW